MSDRFTDRFVAGLKTTGTRYEKWDVARRAFGVRVGETGRKSWIFVYHFDGKARRMTLGRYPRMGLADAGVAYAEARRQLQLGNDPGAAHVEKRRIQRAMSTIRELGEEYIEKHSKPNKRSWEEDQRIFEHDVLPVWGNRKASAVTRADVNALLDEIAVRAPVQANRTFAFIRAMFRFAESRDYIPASPCHGVRARTKEQSRDRLLEPKEITQLWRGLNQEGMSQTVRLAVRFLLLTAQRISEVANAEWSEIDWEKQLWTLPANRVKNGKLHRVPLSKQAMDVLNDIKLNSEKIIARRAANIEKDDRKRPKDQVIDVEQFRAEASRWLFPSPQPEEPIGPQALDRALRRLRTSGHIPDFRPHDLRRTAASHMTRLGIDRLTVHKLLNHSDRSVTAIYDRYDYDGPKRKAVEVWGKEVAVLVR